MRKMIVKSMGLASCVLCSIPTHKSEQCVNTARIVVHGKCIDKAKNLVSNY